MTAPSVLAACILEMADVAAYKAREDSFTLVEVESATLGRTNARGPPYRGPPRCRPPPPSRKRCHIRGEQSDRQQTSQFPYRAPQPPVKPEGSLMARNCNQQAKRP